MTAGTAARARHPAAVGLMGLALVLSDVGPVAAQSEAAELPSDAALLVANTLLGGVTVGLKRLIVDGRFEGFWGGAAGGALGFGGRRIAVMSFEGSGLAGRQVAALGASLTRNSADGLPLLDAFVIPLGPIRLYASREQSDWAWRPRLDLIAAGVLATTLFRHDRTVDWKATASSGALVVDLREPDGTIAGSTLAGTIFVRPNAFVDRRAVIAHERVHVLQKDFAFHVLGDPVEDLLMAADPSLGWFGRYVDLNVVYPLAERALYALLGVAYEARPHEVEASALESR